MSLLALSGVGFGFDGTPVLSDISLTLEKGEVLVILGPSGCGKSSLLRLIAGLVPPDTGTVRLKGDPPRPGQGSAMVFQSYRLLPWKTVAGNLAFALPGLSPAEQVERINTVLAQVGLSRFAQAWPRQLSGGMQQRVALARALVARPDVLLMDEPFAALDAQARELMQVELLRLTGGDMAPGVVFVTHSVDEALMLGDRILVLSPRPGRIMAEITPPFAKTDPRDHPDFNRLRREIWAQMRDSLLNDPASDFYRPV